MASHTASGFCANHLTTLERMARETLALQMGRALDEGEWQRTRLRLLQFVGTLVSWVQAAQAADKPNRHQMQEH